MKTHLLTTSFNRENLTMDTKDWSSRKMMLPNQKNKNGLCWVYVEVTRKAKTYDGQNHQNFKRVMKRFNSGVLVDPKDWSESKQEVKSQHSSEAFEKNGIINDLFSNINTYIIKLKRRTDYIELPNELKELESMFGNGVRARQKTLLDYLQAYIEMRQKRGDMRGTVKEFITVKNRLIAYQEHTKRELQWEDVNLILGDELKNFWKPTYNPNTIKKSFTIFKTFLNHFYERRSELRINLNSTFRFKSFGEIKTFNTDPIALTENEVERIAKFGLKDFKSYRYRKDKKVVKLTEAEIKRMLLTQQRVLLQIGTGLRISDLFKIKPSNIIDGKGSV